jgi:hypothetical protein
MERYFLLEYGFLLGKLKVGNKSIIVNGCKFCDNLNEKTVLVVTGVVMMSN